MLRVRRQSSQADVVVVGAGLAGLIAAARLAKAGRNVVLLEQGKHLGGRAATTSLDGVQFNLGPRALYCHGHAFRLLRELNVPFSGRFPNPGIGLAYYNGREYRLPATFPGLVLTRLLSPVAKWRLARLLRELPRLDTAGLQRTSVKEWVTARFGSEALASFLFAFFRLTSYAADMEHFSVGAAIDQLKIGLAGNVWYIDGGWQTLIDGLRNAAVELGVDVRSGAHVASVRATENGAVTVATREGELRAAAAVLAIAPQKACSLLALPDDHQLVRWLHTSRPIHAACLDIALSKLPRLRHRFALGIDQPYYFSVHSAAARLAPEGVAVIHVMKNLLSGESTQHVEQELERWLDQVQPGWRQHVVTRRFLPSMLVAPDLPQADTGGLAGRPGVKVAGAPGVFLAGDWVGERGQIADASAASAEEASERALQFLQTHSAPQLQYA